MRDLGSLILDAADRSRVPAGRALGVDREAFAQQVTRVTEGEPLIRVRREECEEIPEGYDVVVVATGPLTSDRLAERLRQLLGVETLYFYDSISPVVTADSVDLTRAYFKDRYEAEGRDYLNCPLTREEYERFVAEIVAAEKVPVRAFEAMRCFEACLPLEVLAERGPDTLAFGPMKPVGLEDPRTGKRPHAVVQLRRENEPTTLYNLVGFQTRLKWGEQKRIFRTIPGLEQAEFVRFGSMHRNTYLDSPRLLGPDLGFRQDRKLLFAGQIVGVEGYVESAAMGQWAGLIALTRVRGDRSLPLPPPETAVGALIRAVTTVPLHGVFSPMNINFGLLPPIPKQGRGKEARRRLMVARAVKAAAAWRARVAQDFGLSWPTVRDAVSSDKLQHTKLHG
jgi:methylenetetrahydrofolate--tRNA-(uracil-5-)-methyltransferase